LNGFAEVDTREGQLLIPARSMRYAENVLVLHDVPAVVGQYQAEWERLWEEGESVEKKY